MQILTDVLASKCKQVRESEPSSFQLPYIVLQPTWPRGVYHHAQRYWTFSNAFLVYIEIVVWFQSSGFICPVTLADLHIVTYSYMLGLNQLGHDI